MNTFDLTPFQEILFNDLRDVKELKDLLFDSSKLNRIIESFNQASKNFEKIIQNKFSLIQENGLSENEEIKFLMQVKNNETKDGNLKKIKIEGLTDHPKDLLKLDTSSLKFKVKEVDLFDSNEQIYKTIMFGSDQNNQIEIENKSNNHEMIFKDELILGFSEIDPYIKDVGNVIFY